MKPAFVELTVELDRTSASIFLLYLFLMLNRRDFVKYSSAGLLGATLLNGCRDDSESIVKEETIANRPNIIVLIADDLRWDCIGKLNNIIQTPNLDRLCDRGIFFANNFVTTSICPTSRASIFTGLYARKHEVWDFETALTPKQWRNTYHHLLQQVGYTTAFIGKWGLGGEPAKDEFDYWNGFLLQGNYYTDEREEHLTDYLTTQAENFIRSQPDNFCLTLSYKAPHVDDDPDEPFIPDRKFARQYQNINIPRYDTQTSAQSLPDFLQNTEAQLRYEQRFATEKLYQKSVKNYYRLISGIDESIGRIVNTLEEQNSDRDTYIIFTSDNGFFLGEKGLAGKWFGFEPAIRTPLTITSLKNPQSQTVTDFSLNIDIAPTILGLAKVSLQNPSFQGINLVATAPVAREWWFYEHLFEHPPLNIPVNVGIRSMRYKYLSFPEHDYEMLFDLKRDPNENLNLADNTDYREILQQYRQLVAQSEQHLS